MWKTMLLSHQFILTNISACFPHPSGLQNKRLESVFCWQCHTIESTVRRWSRVDPPQSHFGQTTTMTLGCSNEVLCRRPLVIVLFINETGVVQFKCGIRRWLCNVLLFTMLTQLVVFTTFFVSSAPLGVHFQRNCVVVRYLTISTTVESTVQHISSLHI